MCVCLCVCSDVDCNQRLLELRTEAEAADGEEGRHHEVRAGTAPVGAHEVTASPTDRAGVWWGFDCDVVRRSVIMTGDRRVRYRTGTVH